MEWNFTLWSNIPSKFGHIENFTLTKHLWSCSYAVINQNCFRFANNTDETKETAKLPPIIKERDVCYQVY